MTLSNREFSEHKIASAKISCNSHIPTDENQLLGTEGEHKSISQAIYVPGDNLSDDQWTITIIPPSPNPEASMSEKQATPKKQQQIPQWEGDEIAQCLDACHLG